jgi:plasmid stability protein
MVPVSATLPPDLIAALRAHARACDRSFSAELRRAIRSHLKSEAPVATEASQYRTARQGRYAEG